MNHITAEEYELLGFFEKEPTTSDMEVPWFYRDSLYQVTQGNKQISIAIHPVYKDIHIIIKESDNTLFEFEATGVHDIRVLNNKLPEILEITVNAQQKILVTLKPNIRIYQKYEETT